MSLTIDNHSLTGESSYPLNRDGSIMQKHNLQMLKDYLPKLQILDAKFWETKNVTVVDEPPLDNHEIVAVVNRLKKEFKSDFNRLELTVFTIPKGHKRRYLNYLAQCSKDNPIYRGFNFYEDDSTISQSSRILIIKNIPYTAFRDSDQHYFSLMCQQ